MKKNLTEHQKQLAGQKFNGGDPSLKKLQNYGQQLANDFNHLKIGDETNKSKILKKLFGKIGKNVRVYPPLRVDFGCNIYLGNHVLINQNCTFLDTNKIIIGDRVLIAPDVKFFTATHPIKASERFFIDKNHQLMIATSAKPIMIGNDVWIGGGSIIVPGVKIGNNVVVAAGSVVIHDVPDNVLVAGNPAKIKKSI